MMYMNTYTQSNIFLNIRIQKKQQHKSSNKKRKKENEIKDKKLVDEL